MSLESDKVYYCRLFNDLFSGDFKSRDEVLTFMRSRQRQFIGFNSGGYDMIIMTGFLSNKGNEVLKRMSDDIIVRRIPWWNVYKRHNVRRQLLEKVNHIDICQPAPSVQTSLKLYAGRLGAPRMQDLPVDPSEVLTLEQVHKISKYCDNDLDITKRLYLAIKGCFIERAEMSETYGLDLMSKSDPQIAEAIFKHYLEENDVLVEKRQTKVKPFYYRVPEWVSFESKEFNAMLDKIRTCEFSVSDKGVLVLPKAISNAIKFHGAKYKFGIGGLHSQEKSQSVVPSDDELLSEFDVASLYPSIIIEQGLYPEHLGAMFLKIYTEKRDQRFASKIEVSRLSKIKNRTEQQEVELAKHKRIVAMNKLMTNSSYGKFGSVYSFLYSPELLAQTTITGQLGLLMLIERMVKLGAKVVSANTDGVNVLFKKHQREEVLNACFEWEMLTSYILEETPYLATYNRDVNNYIAIKADGSAKRKGCFAKGSLMKNPSYQVIFDAVVAHVKDGTDIGEHIKNEKDITLFMNVRTVTGGAVFEGEEVGKVVRFYHSKTGSSLNYKKNNNLVPTSTGCRPLMNLDDFIGYDDIDYDWYINEAYSVLEDIGYARK